MKTPSHWYDDGALARVLAPLGWLYGLAGTLRRGAAQPWTAPVAVVCIGNLTAGGTGKTPVAVDIAARLKRRDIKAHLLSRGYGGTEQGPTCVEAQSRDWRRFGDEALLLAQAAPTWVAVDRKAGAEAACKAGAGAIIMDDGFQNSQLTKTLSIIVVDGGVGFGNGRLIPAGPLRETLADGLARTDAVVVMGEDQAGARERINQLAPNLSVFAAELEPLNADAIKGKKVFAFAGIGRPEKFFDTLRKAGADVVESRAFGDHHPYELGEIEAIIKRAEAIGAVPMTTAKDAVKLTPEHQAKVEVLDISIRWENEKDIEAFLERIGPSPAKAEPIAPVTYKKASPVYFISAMATYAGIFLIRLLPLDWASALGGFIGRHIGPLLGVSRIARHNLKAAFPESSAAEINAILADTWENLGRTSAEFAMASRLKHRITIEGLEHLEAVRSNGKPVLFFTSHLANWELTPLMSDIFSMPIHGFYRAPNNPFLLNLFAGRTTDGELIPKGAAGARRAFSLLKKGDALGILIDQKQNDGIAVPFFGRDAMTGTALAVFALHFESPIVPFQVVREEGAHFRVILHPPLKAEKTDDREKDVFDIMQSANAHIESWVREHPGQWLWLHRRWPDS